MPQLSIQELLAEMEATVAERRELLAQDLDFAGLEQAITARLNELGAELVKQVVEPLLVEAGYLVGASLFLALIGTCGGAGDVVFSVFSSPRV